MAEDSQFDLSSLPDRPLPAGALEDLADADQFAQVVAVRGYYVADHPMVIQLVLNLRQRRLLAAHFDGDGWTVVFDSERADLDATGRAHYEAAHRRLDECAPDMAEEYDEYFENDPPEDPRGDHGGAAPADSVTGVVEPGDGE